MRFKKRGLFIDFDTQPKYTRSPIGLINVTDGMNAQIIYSALEDYLGKLDHDKRTKYDGDERYCAEDDVFLDDAIGRVHLLLRDLKSDHPSIVVKG